MVKTKKKPLKPWLAEILTLWSTIDAANGAERNPAAPETIAVLKKTLAASGRKLFAELEVSLGAHDGGPVLDGFAFLSADAIARALPKRESKKLVRFARHDDGRFLAFDGSGNVVEVSADGVATMRERELRTWLRRVARGT
jgi:hypothetical protein